MSASATLCDLAAGDSAVIQDIPAGHDENITRLRELGLVPGTKIRVVRRAPFGDPIEVSVRGSRLAMRSSEARYIRVSQLPPPLKRATLPELSQPVLIKPE
jgi:ferrous iron transport protein A